MKKFFIVLLFVIILGAFLPFLTGLSYSEIYNLVIEKYEDMHKEPYFNDIELEVAQDKNSNDNGTIKAYEALEIAKETYASTFTKIYFSEEEDVYIYKMPNQNMYMAVSQIVVLENRDFYEIILFELDANNDNDKNVLVRYYVDAISGEIYDEKTKPQETKDYLDYGLGFKLAIPVNYKEYIKMDYLNDIYEEADGKEIKVKPVQFNFILEDKKDLLFTLLLFEGKYEKDFFNSTLDNTTYYIGSNDKYTYIVVKSNNDSGYNLMAKNLLKDDFEYILKNITIY